MNQAATPNPNLHTLEERAEAAIVVVSILGKLSDLETLKAKESFGANVESERTAVWKSLLSTLDEYDANRPVREALRVHRGARSDLAGLLDNRGTLFDANAIAPLIRSLLQAPYGSQSNVQLGNEMPAPWTGGHIARFRFQSEREQGGVHPRNRAPAQNALDACVNYAMQTLMFKVAADNRRSLGEARNLAETLISTPHMDALLGEDPMTRSYFAFALSQHSRTAAIVARDPKIADELQRSTELSPAFRAELAMALTACGNSGRNLPPLGG